MRKALVRNIALYLAPINSSVWKNKCCDPWPTASHRNRKYNPNNYHSPSNYPGLLNLYHFPPFPLDSEFFSELELLRPTPSRTKKSVWVLLRGEYGSSWPRCDALHSVRYITDEAQRVKAQKATWWDDKQNYAPPSNPDQNHKKISGLQ